MTNPAQVAAQVRFALSQLPRRNAHHEFEHICRHFTKQFICSNVLPATGPVSAGGDQGRDYETFRSYLGRELGPSGGFLGLVSEGTIAFICTTQSDDIAGKIADDIEKVCASGHPVHEIVAFLLESMPVGARHKLESATHEAHNVRLQVFDADAISELLATTPESFWIAEQYLALPAEIAPPQPLSDERLSEDYMERRTRWRRKRTPHPTIGDFIDLKFGIRFATFQEAARPDLPFWLGLIRELLSDSSLSPSVRQRARYELVVASLRGLGDMRSVDDIARQFLDECVEENEPARLQDAAALIMYLITAALNGVTTITPAEHTSWTASLRKRVDRLLDEATPHRRASLLHTLGYLGIRPPLTEDGLSEARQSSLGNPFFDSTSALGLPEGFTVTKDHFGDLRSTLSAWSKLADGLEEAPLFPIDSLSDHLQFLAPVLVDYAEWLALIERVDRAIERLAGKAAVAERARDRAMAFLRSGRRLEALNEFHRVKVAGWSGDTLRGSLLALLMISRIYLDMRLPQAAKAYSLAAGYVAATGGDDELVDLLPSALFQAADTDYISGAWCSAAQMFELGVTAQYNAVEGGLESEGPDDIDRALIHMARISACARDIDPILAASIHATIGGVDLQEIGEGEVDFGLPADQESWVSFGADDLTSPPFSDLGELRSIKFSGLGTDWVLQSANDDDSVVVAERFAAAAQVMLADLAREDLCVMPTRINVHIEKRQHTGFGSSEAIKSMHSNEGRLWVVQLAPATTAGSADPEQIHEELLEMLTRILFDVSLLPETDFSAVMSRATRSGLAHKVSLARPYDELVAMFFDYQIERVLFNTPWDSLDSHNVTPNWFGWRDHPGPTFSKEKAEHLLKTRYRNLSHALQQIIPFLRAKATFRDTVANLRAKGWLDWHLLTAIHNIAVSHRINRIAHHLGPDRARRALGQVARSPEVETVEGLSATLFTYEKMQNQRKVAMLSLLQHWGLQLHQETPDFPGIEGLLGVRYGYWDDDVEHINPFPHAD